MNRNVYVNQGWKEISFLIRPFKEKKKATQLCLQKEKMGQKNDIFQLIAAYFWGIEKN